MGLSHIHYCLHFFNFFYNLFILSVPPVCSVLLCSINSVCWYVRPATLRSLVLMCQFESLRLKAWKAFIFFNAQASERVPGAVSSWLIATCYFYMLWKPLWPLALLCKPPEFCQQQLAQEPSSYQSKSDGFGVDFNQHTLLWNTVRIRPWGMRAVSCTLASRNHVWMLFLSCWKVKIWKYLSTALWYMESWLPFGNCACVSPIPK